MSWPLLPSLGSGTSGQGVPRVTTASRAVEGCREDRPSPVRLLEQGKMKGLGVLAVHEWEGG